jgi:hypothetical protein
MSKLTADGLLASAPDTIALFSGGWLRPLDPDPADITIQDIAHALSNQCRFTGHTREFYSVAEHCVLASGLMTTDELALDALLHDGSEAYLADLARPIKKAPGLGEVYLKAEEKLEAAIAKRFGTTHPMPDEVKWADNVMLGVEVHMLMHAEFAAAFPLELPLDAAPQLKYWNPPKAEIHFMATFETLAWKLGKSSLLDV